MAENARRFADLKGATPARMASCRIGAGGGKTYVPVNIIPPKKLARPCAGLFRFEPTKAKRTSATAREVVAHPHSRLLCFRLCAVASRPRLKTRNRIAKQGIEWC